MVWLLCIAEMLCCHEGFVFYRFQVCGRPLAAGVGKLEALLQPGPGPAGTPRPRRCAGSWHGLSQGRPGGASPGRPLTAAAGSGLAPPGPGRACQADWSPLSWQCCQRASLRVKFKFRVTGKPLQVGGNFKFKLKPTGGSPTHSVASESLSCHSGWTAHCQAAAACGSKLAAAPGRAVGGDSTAHAP